MTDQQEGGGENILPPPPPPPHNYNQDDPNAINQVESDTDGSHGMVRRSQRRRQRRPSSTTDGATTDGTTGDFTDDQGIERLLRPIGVGAAMALQAEDYADREKQRMRKKIKRRLHRATIKNALAEQRRALQEEMQRRLYADEALQLDKGLEDGPPASSAAYAEARKTLKKYGSPLLGNNLDNLSDFLNLTIEVANESALNGTQVARILGSHLKGPLGLGVRRMLKKEKVTKVIEYLRKFQCPNLSIGDCQRTVVAWKFNKRKVRESVFGLYMSLSSAYPRTDSNTILEFTKLRVKENLPPTSLDDLIMAEEHDRITTGVPMDLPRFITEVEKIVGKHPTTQTDTLDVMKAALEQPPPPPIQHYASPPQLPPPPPVKEHEENLAKVVQELSTKVDRVLTVQAQPPAPPPAPPAPSMPQFVPVPMYGHAPYSSHPPPPPPMPTSTPPQTFAPPPPSGFRQGFNKQGQGQGYTFVREGDPKYEIACTKFSKSDSLNKNLPEVPREMVPFLKNQDGTIQPAPHVKVTPFPRGLAVFGFDAGKQRFNLTRAIKTHFENKCATCGLPGHRSSSKYCPMASAADSWNLCPTCRLGFHTNCVYNKDFLAANSKN